MRALLGLSVLMVLAGCCSEQQKSPAPSATTGPVNNYPTALDIKQGFTDDKGHYHPEWVYGINTPEQYPIPTPNNPDLRTVLGME